MNSHQDPLRQLRWSLQALAAAPEDQLALLPGFGRPLELVEEFERRWNALRERIELGFDFRQVTALDRVQQAIDALPEGHDDEGAVRGAETWETLRRVAQEALVVMGWPRERPPIERSRGSRWRTRLLAGGFGAFLGVLLGMILSLSIGVGAGLAVGIGLAIGFVIGFALGLDGLDAAVRLGY
jgi:hypothetical protein